MKNTRFRTAIWLLSIMFLMALSVRAQTLGGQEAVNQLRKTGDYESLKLSFEQARNGLFDQLSAPNAVIQTAILTSSDGVANDRFGESVSISGDTAVVGDIYHDVGGLTDSGAAYVFVKSGTTWTQQAILTASDGTANDFFGSSVSIDGNTIIVGSPNKEIGIVNGYRNKGAIYIFVRSGTIWSQQIRLSPTPSSFPGVISSFGRSVLISGDTLIVGEPTNSLGDQSSAVFVYARNGTGWSFQQKLTAMDFIAQDASTGFGSSLSISGNSLIVGDPYQQNGTSFLRGAAYIYVKNGSVWTSQQKLTAYDSMPGDTYGNSVSIDGNTMIVGAYESLNRAGSAYIYIRNGTTWSFQQKLTGSGLNGRYRFGNSVAVVGDTAFISTNYFNSMQGESWLNKVFIFTRNGSTWTEQERFSQTSPYVFSRFGWSMATDGNNIIVGDISNQNSSGSQGAAYIFNRNVTLNSKFDFDGDGKADVSVFRPSNGAWYLQQSTNGFTGLQFGLSTDKLVPADYDGDGKTDVAVYRGGTWYLQRSQLGFTGVAFGLSDDIPVPADYDGDGKADIAVFRPSNGSWYILRSTLGFTGVQFGQSGDKPVAGDYDGDGKADVAVNRSGIWYILRSALGFTGVQFGDANDKLVPADYDGDGKTDLAVFRPSNGVWYLQQSTAGFTGIAFGLGTDLPTPADYDGDGKADVGVFRNGTWYLQRSTQGFTGVAFGVSTDTPIPNAYVR